MTSRVSQQSGSGTARDTSSSVMSSSVVMATGTVVSRTSGYLRTILLAAALGTALHADVFTISNTIPNMLYILLAGGIFNAVLVPQLVRALRNDPDGGEAYTNRLITLAMLFLGAVTLVLVVAAPLLMRLFLSANYFTPELAAQRQSAIDFARFCLPQVFFYGMFVLVGQVLNARGRFGPMMWAPIANNVVATGVLGAYLVVFGPARDLTGTGASAAALSGPGSTVGGFSSGQVLLLGLGSTVGIALQLAVLVPYLRAAGLRYRPRFDFRDAGLGHTLRLGGWTVLFVVVNQIAYTVVVRLASAGTAGSGPGGGTPGTGYTVYSSAFLLVMVPHSIITVSLATAMLPTLSAYAAEGRLSRLGRAVGSTLRSTYALVVPAMALLPVIALETANVIWRYGAASTTYADFAPTLSLFALGIFFFTTHYLMLRGFYALEMTRRVFYIQCVVSVVNIAAAVLLTRGIDPRDTAPRLVLAYAAAYAVGSAVSYALLRREVGSLGSRTTVRFLVRLALAVGAATAAAAGTRAALVSLGLGGPDASKLAALVVVLLCGAVDIAVLLVVARLLRITEIGEVLDAVTSRLRRRRAPADA